MQMPLFPTWPDIVMRLILTLIASAALGINRGQRGHAAGFRTTVLVGLAACVAMIQANILLSVGGKTPDSFGVMDLMRLPLGILTGVGFIGGGSILKKGELVTGVTTAATLWIVTTIGLCFGGGQFILGMVGSVLAVITLSALKWIDVLIPREHRSRLVLETTGTFSQDEFNDYIKPFGYRSVFQGQVESGGAKQIEFEIHWKKSEQKNNPFELVKLLENKYKVLSFELTAEKTDHII